MRWLPAMFVMALIYCFSSTQGASKILPENLLEGVFKHIINATLHLGVYGLLALALEYGFGKNDRKTRLKILPIVFLYNITDEYHQSFVPRHLPKVCGRDV